ncbi:MAG: hypothetical protein KC535_00210 [Nanoarchaeota archaeon]|nr:hypothetical protein [Nanoarchaeota archaeon]
MELFEWCKHYIKFKDCMKRNIVSLEERDHEILVKEKQRDIRYLIDDDINKSISALTDSLEVIVAPNTKANFDALIDQWDELKNHKQLTVIFCHPDNNETWLVHPSTHHHIAEQDTFKEGLQSLFEGISRV